MQHVRSGASADQPRKLALEAGHRRIGLVRHLLTWLAMLAVRLWPWAGGRQGLPRASARLITATGAARERALHRAPRSDWARVHQTGEIVLSPDQSAGWYLQLVRGHLVALGRPLGDPQCAALRQVAQDRGCRALLFGCDARAAARARAAGWQVRRIGDEALIDTTTWRDAGPAHGKLRQELRRAQAGGLRVTISPDDLPLRSMATVAAIWEAATGSERRFLTGRFHPDHLARQCVVLGHVGPRLVGFVTFHLGPRDWTLDLARMVPDAPVGTVQALIAAALCAARDAGVPTVSLGLAGALRSVPLVARLLVHRHHDRAECRLRQSFAPSWQPLYACAPGGRGVIAGLLALYLADLFPAHRRVPHETPSPVSLPERQLRQRVDDLPSAPLEAQGRTSAMMRFQPPEAAQKRFESRPRPCDAMRENSQQPVDPARGPTRAKRGHANDRRPFPPA